MPILDPNSIEFISRSPEQTRRVGMRLGAIIRDRDLICLEGDLGSGKTTFVQGLAAGWGSLDQVSSPTYVLVNLYRHPIGKSLYHVDAYRLNSSEEAEDLDLDAILSSGSMVIEWAERIKPILPVECMWIKLKDISADQRDLIFTGHGKHYRAILDIFRRRLYGDL